MKAAFPDKITCVIFSDAQIINGVATNDTSSLIFIVKDDVIHQVYDFSDEYEGLGVDAYKESEYNYDTSVFLTGGSYYENI